jgi:hypothetical protein
MLAMSFSSSDRRRTGNPRHSKSKDSDSHGHRCPTRAVSLGSDTQAGQTIRPYNPAMATARDRIGADVIVEVLEARRDKLISTGVAAAW